MVPLPCSNVDKSILIFLCKNVNFFNANVCFLADNVLAEAKKRYEAAVANGGERLISGSDDFTLFLWAPESSKNSIGNNPY